MYLCMYVCVHTHIHMNIYVYIYIYIYMQIRINIHVHLLYYSRVYTYMYVYIYIYRHIDMYVYSHADIPPRGPRVVFFPRSGCVAPSVEVWLRELASCRSVGRSVQKPQTLNLNQKPYMPQNLKPIGHSGADESPGHVTLFAQSLTAGHSGD